MMIGEFEYDTIYTDGVVNYKTISYIMFCVFMVVMSIIIMNLLVCYACFFSKGLSSEAQLVVQKTSEQGVEDWW